MDNAGDAYITGFTCSSDFPITLGAFQTTYISGSCADLYGEAFVTKFNGTGSALVYSTYLGGSNYTEEAYAVTTGSGIAVDSAGNAYVTGSTDAINFPTMNPLQSTNGGYDDAFVTKLNATGSALIYSTYLGGNNGDGGNGIAVDSAGNAYVTGLTTSANFPVTPGAFQTTCGNPSYCYGAAFVSKLNPMGSALTYSTYLGGNSGGGVGMGIAVDSAGDAYVTGDWASKKFPTTPGAFQKTCKPGGHAFVTRFTLTGAALVYSTCLEGSGSDGGIGIAVDSMGNAYVAGSTNSTDFPTMNPLQAANGGSSDAFVAKIPMLAVTTTTLSSSPNPSTYGEAVTFTAVVTSYLGTPTDGETVSFMKGKKVLGTGTLSHGSASFTTSTLPVGTNSITAMYGGDSNFASSTSKAITQVVNKATTTTALASSPNPSKVGQSVTFTASVTPEFSGMPTGKVAFYDGTTLLKSVALSGGTAKFTTSTLTSGTHSITATYNGSTDFTGSSASLTQTVN